MKIQTIALGFGCALVAACSGLPPAASAPGPEIDMRLDPPPIHALIGHRADLDLTSEQIDALDEVGQEIHAENNPLLLRLHDVEQNSGSGAMQQEVLQLAGRIHMNNHRAMERVRGVLTEEQRDAACSLFGSSNGTARALRTVESDDGSLHSLGRSTTHLELGAYSQNGAVWNWCAEAVPATAAR